MANMKDLDHHLIEIIPLDQKKTISSAIKNHPSTEISESPGHLLLLKLLQREQDLSAHRITRKETRLDTLRREIFQLCLFFFMFHGLFLTILFKKSLNNDNDMGGSNVCDKWWIPMMTSLCFCVVMVCLVHMKLFGYWRVYGEVLNERSENRGLTRCVQELRVKGVGFDLNKEYRNVKRMKSSSVEIKWKPVEWFFRYFVTIGLGVASGLVIPVCKFMICS